MTYGGNTVQFDPGSSAVHILDPETLEHRSPQSADLVRLIKVAELLPAYDAQSTAVICDDVPKEIGDLYRLYLVLMYSIKPVVTGAFSRHASDHDRHARLPGGRPQALADRPQAVFDVCPSPPLIWSRFGAENLMELALASVPAEIVSMPLAGAAAPVTLLGGDHTARRRVPERHHHPSTGQSGCSHRLGWRTSDIRHAEGHHADGRGGDRHDRCLLCRGRQIPGPAHALLSGRQQFASLSTPRPVLKAG